jgi:hypothetical protein
MDCSMTKNNRSKLGVLSLCRLNSFHCSIQVQLGANMDSQNIGIQQLRTSDGTTVQFGPCFAIRLLVLRTKFEHKRLQTRGTELHLGKAKVSPWLDCLERKINDDKNDRTKLGMLSLCSLNSFRCSIEVQLLANVDLQIIDIQQSHTSDCTTVQFGPCFAIQLLVLLTSLSTAANTQLQTRSTEVHLGKAAEPPWLDGRK